MIKKLPLFFSLTMLILAGAGATAQESISTSTYTQAVTRDVLASGYPTSDQGQILELVRFTIAPKAKLPLHIHPGMQVVQVEAGTLTYTVVEGQAQVTKADGTIITLQAGKNLQLTVGDALVEAAGMVHFGENQTDRPLKLLSASLMATDQPRAILINPESK